jgi:hypothetical protein
MKRLLLAAVTALALVAPALAAEPTIPAEYRGDWCEFGNSYLRGPMQRKHVPINECDAVIRLTATRMIDQDGHPGHPDCKLTSIKSVIVDKVNLPEGIFTCPEGVSFRFVFTTGSGSLGYKARRLYLTQPIMESNCVLDGDPNPKHLAICE